MLTEGALARAAAATAVAAVLDQGQSLTRALATLAPAPPPRQAGLVREIAYGTLRWQPRLRLLLAPLLRRPLRARDRVLASLLLTGIYQLEFLRIPAHAAVKETVAAATGLGRPWAASLVNGVLRAFQRRAEELRRAADRDPEGRWAHPRWLIDRLREAWPGDWQQVLEAGNRRPPMTLRVNRLQGSREACLEELAAAGIGAATPPSAPLAPDALVLERAVDVEALPGFATGRVSVQDAAAQLAAPLLRAEPGMRVLDACAAPGGKTAHILERCPELGELVAVDLDPARLARVGEGLERLGLPARGRTRIELLAGDAGEPSGWWDGRPFDRILLDAPCSATGVVRRHPDIKVLRRAEDLPALAGLQARMLDALWPLLAPGGRLVYATCSVLPEENGRQVAAFLARTGDAVAEDPAAVVPGDWGRAAGPGRQILSGEQDMDGFYYACLCRARRGAAGAGRGAGA